MWLATEEVCVFIGENVPLEGQKSATMETSWFEIGSGY